MKHLLYTFVICAVFTASSLSVVAADVTTHTAVFAQPTITHLKDCDAIRIAGLAVKHETLSPEIPYSLYSLALPSPDAIKDITVHAGPISSRNVSLKLPLAGKPYILSHPPRSARETRFLSARYPRSFIHTLGVQTIRRKSYALFKITPVQYDPANSSLSYITQVSFSFPSSWKITQEHADAAPAGYTFLPPASYAASQRTDSQPGYVVIAPATFTNKSVSPSLHTLIAHRQLQGLKTLMSTKEDIVDRYPRIRPDGNRDDATAIRHYIRHVATNDNVQYVLLCGDSEHIPLRGMYGEYDGVVLNSVLAGGSDTNIPSDMYYACLDGTLDDNANGWYGETNDGLNATFPDIMPDIAIGRLPANNLSALSLMIDKIIAYETTPVSSPYATRALMAGEYLGNFDLPYGATRMDAVKYGCTNAGMETAGFPPNWTVDTLYDQDGTWSRDTFIALANTGQFQLISHLGHAYYSTVLKMYRDTVNNMTNSYPLFIYSEGCYAGALDYDCMAERFLESPHACFSVVMNSRYGLAYEDNIHGPSDRFNRRFFSAIFSNKVYRTGNVLNHSRQALSASVYADMNVRWVCYEMNILGDPATPLTQFIPEPASALFIVLFLTTRLRRH